MERRTILKAAAAVALPSAAAALFTASASAATTPAQNNDLVAICEQKQNQIQIYPAAQNVWDSTTLQWSYSAGTANGWNLLSDVKFRASTAFGTLVLVTASGGRAGIIQQSTGTLLWSVLLPSLVPTSVAASVTNPHSIERIPNSDVIVVANTTPGGLTLLGPTNSDDPSTLKFVAYYDYPQAHGVWWDDQSHLLWAAGGTNVTAYQVNGAGTAVSLSKVANYPLPASQGAGTSVHSLDADYADPTSLLLTSGSGCLTINRTTGAYTTLTGPLYDAGVKALARDSAGASLWVKTDSLAYDGGSNNWSSPYVQFFDSAGNEAFRRQPSQSVYAGSGNLPEIYRARLVTTAFH